MDSVDTDRAIPDNNNDNAFSITSKSAKFVLRQPIYYQIQIIVLYDLNALKGIRSAAVCVHWTRIQCTDDVITAINEAITQNILHDTNSNR